MDRSTGIRLGILLAAALSFAGAVWLLNVSGAERSPTVGPAGDDPFGLVTGKGKGKGKGKAKGPAVALVPDDELWVAGAAPEVRGAPPAGAPNVVLVLLSSVRRDALEPYGAPAGRSPEIAALAAQGARFTDAVAAAPHPRGAQIAVATGQHAVALGLVDPGPGPEVRPVPPEVTTLAERLQAAGWATYGATANHNLNTAGGLAQGFDRYRNAQETSFHPEARIPAGEIVREALVALDERPAELAARPFLLQLAFADAHAPLRRYPQLEASLEPDRPNVAYRAAVRKIDEAIGKLVDELDARGHEVGTDTVLVLVAEHGEGNGEPEHHGKYHGHLLYESSVGVPWIVVGPGIPPGRAIGGLASQTDVGPTVLALAGAPAAAAAEGLDGRSWAAPLRGEGDRTDRQRAFSDTWYFGTDRASIWTATTACQKDYGSVPTDAGGGGTFADGCYDRTVDPEFRNLQQDPSLLAELDAWRAAHPPIPQETSAPTPGAPESPTPDGAG